MVRRAIQIAVGGSLVALVVLAAIFAPLIAPWDPTSRT
jgi:hypothetical protein